MFGLLSHIWRRICNPWTGFTLKNVLLTDGPIFQRLIRFSLPMIAGNLLQQIYNLADALIVGKHLGADALAAVGS